MRCFNTRLPKHHISQNIVKQETNLILTMVSFIAAFHMLIVALNMLELFQIHFRILAGLLTKRSGGPSPQAWAAAIGV